MTMMMLQILSMLDAHHRVNLPPFRRSPTARLIGMSSELGLGLGRAGAVTQRSC